ncbi:MAG: hypothetical protein ACOYON_06235 [Fimbriimonas sp.]
MRRAAEVGPGYRGKRRETSPAERRSLVRLLQEQGDTPPPYLTNETQWVDRRAKLFEAGTYPDKGVTVSPDDLDRLSANFDLPVPVLIEHADSPFELGFLTFVERVGEELYGSLALTAEANDLIERSGAKKLSLGLSADLTAIREVSLVRHPRIETAQLFAGDLDPVDPSAKTIDFRQAYERLMREKQEKDAADEVRQFIREGRLVPAQAEEARQLLAMGISFGESTVRDLVRSLLMKLPKKEFAREIAPASHADLDAALMMPEEAEFYRKHFPGVSLKEIARVR